MRIFLTSFKGSGIRAQLLRGTSGVAGLRFLNIALTLAVGILLARILGPQNYGIYTFILTLVTLLGLPTKAGLPTLLIRETAKNQLNQNWGLIRGLIKLANIFVFSYSIAISLIAGLTIWWYWKATGSNTEADTFLWALWLLPLIAFEGVRTGTLRGLRWVVSSQLPEQLVRPFMMILFLVAVLLLGEEITSITAIQLNAMAALIAFAVGAYFLIKALPKDVKQAKSEYAIRPWAASLMPLSLFAGLKMLDSQVSILFLGFLGTSEEVGLFRVAATGASLVSFGLIVVNMTLAPQVARLYEAREMKKLQRIITLSTRAVAAISFPVALIFILFGKPVISMVFGEEYVKAATALGILCVGQLVNATAGSVGLVLNMTGNDKLTFIASVIALLVHLLLAFILIPPFGLIGAAFSFAVSITIWNIILIFMTKRKVGINTFLV